LGGFHTPSLSATPRVDVYDPATDAWTRLADMPANVTHHTAALDGTSIWVVGGFLGDNGGPALRMVMRYDIPTDTWDTNSAPFLPAQRAGGALVRRGRRLHYFGGFATRIVSAAEHWVLDLDDVAAGWDTTGYAPLPVARGHLSGVLFGGDVYAIGGQDGHDVDPTDLNLVHRYEAGLNAWLPVANLPAPRSHFEAGTFVHDGRIVIAGGRNNQPGGAPTLDEITAYDPGLDAWVELPGLPHGLIGPSAKPIGGELYVTTGGTSDNSPELEQYVREFDDTLGPVTRVNAGGPAIDLSEAWCEDEFFVDGADFTTPNRPAIAGTTDDELYWTERTGTVALPEAFSYRFPVADGDYRITLHFAEIFWNAPGERVFDVSLEGALVLDDYDIVARVGPLAADLIRFDVLVDDGELDLDFLSSVDRPKVSGIEILRLPDDTYDAYCPGRPNSVGSGATLGFRGTARVQDHSFRLLVDGLPPNQPAMFAASASRGSTPVGDGVLCLGGPLFTSPIFYTGPQGQVDIKLPLTASFPVGIAWSFQLAYLDAPPGLLNFSSALEVRFSP